MAGNNVAFALGLAQKAGKTASGDVAVRAALKSGKVKVLVLAQDAAHNSKKEIYFLAEMAGVQVIERLTRDELGYAIGKGPRIAVAKNNKVKSQLSAQLARASQMNLLLIYLVWRWMNG